MRPIIINQSQKSSKVDSNKPSLSSHDSTDSSIHLHSHTFTTFQNIVDYFLFHQNNWEQRFSQYHPNLFRSFQQIELSRFFQNSNPQTTNPIFKQNSNFSQCIIRNKTFSFLQTYHQFHRENLEKKLFKSGRFRKVDSFRTQLSIEEIHSSKHCEIIKLEIQLLWYKTQILILNDFQECSLSSMSEISDSGSFGTVYLLKVQNERFGIKCLYLSKEEKNENQCRIIFQNNKAIIQGMKEYFFVCLLSQMQIGPKVKTIGGFDMILNKDCIKFCTQICQLSKQKNYQKLKKELSESLFQMHMLQIVHRDIKPSNIMYSPTFKKYIFIDFGCSDGLKETLGQKKVTKFIGTTFYCGDQMLSLFSKNLGEVDLYFNDVLSLGKTFERYQFDSAKQQNTNEIKNSNFLMIKMKYELYSQKYGEFNETWRNVMKKYLSENEEIQVKLLHFFKDLKINQRLKEFYWKQIDENVKEMPEFKQLKILMQGKSFNLTSIVDFPSKQKKYINFLKLYQQIKIQCSNFTREQNQISLILLSKQNITRYFQEIQTKLSENYDFVGKLEVIKLSVIVAYYATFAENKYGSSAGDKIKACVLAIKMLQKQNYIKSWSQNLFSKYFSISVKQLCQVSNFYQIFWFKIWRRVPQNHKDKTALNSIITLHLISPPQSRIILSLCIYDEPNSLIQQKNLEDFQGIQSSENRNISKEQIFLEKDAYLKIKRMCLFWQIILINSLFKWSIFYIKQDSTSQYATFQQINDQILKKQRNWIQNDLENELLKINKNYYNNIIRNFDQRSLQQLFINLENPHIFQLQLKYSTVKKWKFLISIVLSCFRGKFSMLPYRNLLQNQNQQTINIQIYKSNIMLYQIVLFFCRGQNLEKFPMIFKKIQEIFNFKKLFVRFNLQIQLRVSMKVNDWAFIKEVTQIIKGEPINFQIFEIQEHQTLIYVLRIILTFLYEQIKKSPIITQELFHVLSQLFQFVSFGWEIGFHYLFEKKNNFIFPADTGTYTQCSLYHFILNIFSTRSFIKVLVSLGKLYQKVLLHAKYKRHKLKISEQHLKLINIDINNRQIISLNEKWPRIISFNPHLKKIIKQSFPILSLFVRFYFDEFRTISQIQRASEIINLLFQDLKPEDFSITEQRQSLPTLNVAFFYYQIKLMKSQYSKNECQDMIKLYKISAKQNTFQTVFSHAGLLRYIFNALIFAQRPYEEIFEYLLHLSQCVYKLAQNLIISIFVEELNSWFYCLCEDCFPRKPENWEPQKFTEYLHQKIKSLSPTQNPYMALVYFHSMTNKNLKTEVVKNIVIYALKSIKFLIPIARREILKKIYFYVFKAFYYHKIKNILSLISHQNGIIKSKIPKSQRNNKVHRRYLHNYLMQTKYDESTKLSLQSLLQKCFVKQFYFNNYKYPNKIREIFKKKWRRYFEVKQDYLRSAESKDVLLTNYMPFYESVESEI